MLQIGDRIQTINGKPADKYERLEDIAKLTVVITIQFDVEVHSCSDGPFSVTITRSEGSGFGITISGQYLMSELFFINILQFQFHTIISLNRWVF